MDDLHVRRITDQIYKEMAEIQQNNPQTNPMQVPIYLLCRHVAILYLQRDDLEKRLRELESTVSIDNIIKGDSYG